METAVPFLYPTASKAALMSQYVGKKLSEIPTPAAVIDKAIAERNCRGMLQAARWLGLRFRPHVKTHKVPSSVLSLYVAFRCLEAGAVLHNMC